MTQDSALKTPATLREEENVCIRVHSPPQKRSADQKGIGQQSSKMTPNTSPPRGRGDHSPPHRHHDAYPPIPASQRTDSEILLRQSYTRSDEQRPSQTETTEQPPKPTAWSRLENSFESSTISKWKIVQRIKAALPAVRKSKYSRTLGSIFIPDDSKLIPRQHIGSARAAVTWSIVCLLLLPLGLLALLVATSNITLLTFAIYPWVDRPETTNTSVSVAAVANSSVDDSELFRPFLSHDDGDSDAVFQTLADPNCRRAPPWMSAIFGAEVRTAVDRFPMPAPLLGGGFSKVSVGPISVTVENLRFTQLHVDDVQLSACYEDLDTSIALPLLLPPHKLLSTVNNVQFTIDAQYNVYGMFGVPLGWGTSIVRGSGTVVIGSDPSSLHRAITSCAADFDEMNVELHGMGQGIAPSDVRSLIDFGQLVCKGVPAYLVEFSGDSLPSGQKIFRGLPTEVDQIVLEFAPKVHHIARVALCAFVVLTVLAVAGVVAAFLKVREIDRGLWMNRTLFGYYAKRWLGRSNAAALQFLLKQCLFCTGLGFVLAIVSLSYVYLRTDVGAVQ